MDLDFKNLDIFIFSEIEEVQPFYYSRDCSCWSATCGIISFESNHIPSVGWQIDGLVELNLKPTACFCIKLLNSEQVPNKTV
jgi:hypothetical protein